MRYAFDTLKKVRGISIHSFWIFWIFQIPVLAEDRPLQWKGPQSSLVRRNWVTTCESPRNLPILGTDPKLLAGLMAETHTLIGDELKSKVRAALLSAGVDARVAKADLTVSVMSNTLTGVLRGIRVDSIPGVNLDSSIIVESLEFDVKATSLAKGPIHITRMKLVSPLVLVRRGENQKVKARSVSEEPKSEDQDSSLRIDRITVVGGEIRVLSKEKPSLSSKVTLPDFDLAHLGGPSEGIQPEELVNALIKKILYETLQSLNVRSKDLPPPTE